MKAPAEPETTAVVARACPHFGLPPSPWFITWFTRRVQKRCRELNLTLKQVAARIGYSRPGLARVIHRHSIREEHLARISKALEVTEEFWRQPLPVVKRRSKRELLALLRDSKATATEQRVRESYAYDPRAKRRKAKT